jgi:hypothetical protein
MNYSFLTIKNIGLNLMDSHLSLSPYNSLLSFKSATDKAVSKQMVLQTLGQCLIEHEMQYVFGIHLLHNHFELEEGESLTRAFSLDSIRLMPTKSTNVSSYVWKIQTNGVQAVEFFTPDQNTARLEKASYDLEEGEYAHAVSCLYAILAENDCEDIFGLALLSNVFFSLEDGKVLNESHSDERELLVSMQNNDSLDTIDSRVATVWAFSSGKMKVAQACGACDNDTDITISIGGGCPPPPPSDDKNDDTDSDDSSSGDD